MDGREQRRARLARRLEQVLGREEAETLMAQLPPYDWPDLATKQDLAELRGDMEQLRTDFKGEIEQLRTELKGDMAQLRGELKGDVVQLRGEMEQLRGEMGQLRGDMEQLRTELKGDMAQLRGEMGLEMAKHVRTHIIATVTAVAATGSLAFTAAGLM